MRTYATVFATYQLINDYYCLQKSGVLRPILFFYYQNIEN